MDNLMSYGDNDLVKSDQKLIEFVHHLQEAIKKGTFQLNSSPNNDNKSHFLNQSNVDNLSNQTFTYIVNWLKQHQLKCDQKKNFSGETEVDQEMFDYVNEIKCLKNKLKQCELDKENLMQNLNQLQEENIDLKTKLLTFGNNNSSNSVDEVEKLKKITNELTRLNEEKDRKIDELTKQVLRFKRIQEIVLSAQGTSNLSMSKHQNILNDSDFETALNENLRNEDSLDHENKTQTENDSNKPVQQIINSSSLTSSISSSSSSSTSSSTSSNSFTTSTTQICPNLNSQPSQLQAPLATISEFTSYSSCSSATTTTLNQINKIKQQSTEDLIEKNNSQIKSPIISGLSSPNEQQEARAKTKSSKYSSALVLSSTQTKSVSPSPIKNSNSQSIRQFFGKLIRTSLVNINDSNFQQSINNNSSIKNSNFKRGGFRSTANARLQSNSNLDTLTFSKWQTSQVCEFLNKNGFDAYFLPNQDGSFSHKWIKNGLHLLQATQYDYEKELGIKNHMHRKKLSLFLQAIINSTTNLSQENQNLNKLDQYWVLKWLDDIGLPQYKDVFTDNMIDGRMLMHINNEDFQYLNINSELHYLSIKRAIHVLRLNNFDSQCLRRRPSGDENLDKSEVMLWTNHRVMEWLRSIDLSEYAPNLRGSGVHGGLMVFEARFNSTVLADILSIPSSKTLLRRHLTTLFNDLIGQQMFDLKKKAESQPGYQQLSASSKVKHVKKNNIAMGSLFSSTHKRTKSQDSRDFLSLTPIVDFKQQQLGNKKDNFNRTTTGQSSTLPLTSSSINNCDLNSFKNKLSILTQENIPTSIV